MAGAGRPPFFARQALARGSAAGGIRKGEEAEEIFRFIKFWTHKHGRPPQHLVFDSKLTTYEQLDRLDQKQITFITTYDEVGRRVASPATHPSSLARRTL